MPLWSVFAFTKLEIKDDHIIITITVNLQHGLITFTHNRNILENWKKLGALKKKRELK